MIALVMSLCGADFPTNPFAPAPLKTIPTPKPPNLADFVQNEVAAIELGKALFWDMQVGSDGITACASCHFNAGADSRLKNQLSPGLAAGDQQFEVDLPNHTLQTDDFPFHQLSNPNDRHSDVLFDSNDVAGSQGVFRHDFVAIRPGSSVEAGKPVSDPIFNVNGVNVRQSTGRNAPSVINAVFNFANFWDGRANNVFNGVNPVGPTDTTNGVFKDVNGLLQEQLVRLPDSSLASQAVGPPMSDVEMAFSGRAFADIGKKMVRLRPLAKQLVHTQDQLLGRYSRATLKNGQAQGLRGLKTPNYSDMIKKAFRSQFWQNTNQIVTIDASGLRQIAPLPPRALAANEYTQMEANFALFFGLAVQAYEATLVSNDTPFDRYQEGQTAALNEQQLEGLEVFLTTGRCVFCHGGPEFTIATVTATVHPPEPLGMVANMSGNQEIPPVATAASGETSLIFNPARTQIEFEVEVVNISGITGATINLGNPGENGPALFVLTNQGFDTQLTGTLNQSDLIPAPGINTLDDVINAMLDGQTYANITTLAHPEGEIRGHLLVEAVLPIDSPLSGIQVVPPVATSASGDAVLNVDSKRSLISYFLKVRNIADVTGARIHYGAARENGPVMFVLSNTAFSIQLTGTLTALDFIPSEAVISMSQAIEALMKGNAYITVETAAYPEGEIRGQLVFTLEGLIERMGMAVGEAFYDTGYYNLGVRPTDEDIGKGGTGAFGYPLSFSRMALLQRDGLLPPEIAQYVPELPCEESCDLDRVAVDGAFKTPSLRNVELTAPYFHNGGIASLRQVVDFYVRGGDFHEENIDNLAPLIDVIPGMNEEKEEALISFLLALTDPRVKNESAPFDHPELFLLNGAKGDEIGIIGDCNKFVIGGAKQCEEISRVPAVGAGGRSAAGLPLLQPLFDQFEP
ncbi:CHRD domain-containing protein [Candidatus Poribacteria bacterium]|nr:CHRD domain-containing protein [Candidatus Poribacteria bacterium]